MKIKIVGVQEQDYKLDNGYAFKGRKIHAIDLDSSPAGLTGNVVINLKIPADSPFATLPLVVGSTYVCYFTQKGALDFIKEDRK